MPLYPDLMTTADGSHTLALPGTNVTYHSAHGAVQESMHVYIREGWEAALNSFPQDTLRVFEMGFGTGLNALLTAAAAFQEKRNSCYNSIDWHPLPAALLLKLNYGSLLRQEALWQQIITAPWNETCRITPYFSLHKQKADLRSGLLTGAYHLIYFDAFSPTEDPELWQEAIFRNLWEHTVPGGILVTYCSKSSVRKSMMAAGWQVRKLPGPRGKRDIVQAQKPF